MNRPLLTLALAGLACPAFADTVTVDTATGPVEVETPVGSVAVYDLAALDTLDALGVEVTASINNTYLERLSQYEGDIGTLFEPDFEALNALSPDLIIAGGRSSAVVPQLSDFATTLDMTIPTEGQLDTILARIDTYGEIFGLRDAAADLRDELDSALDATADAVADKGDMLIVMTNGTNVSAYGAASRFGWLHTATGLPEASSDIDDTTHGEAISFEFIREIDPDWLFVIDRGAAIGQEGPSAEATLDNALVRETTAWETGQVIYLNSAELYITGGGAQSTLNTLETIRSAFGSNS
ncbi:siderophore ABC transporter substrate-binding protein [Pelagovum pacificum]|uniref:Siderophore ABC transporter substrate-binding protein n=1 Tax=Pelagovum pacificum TaxID=2588711 RepID=A0A5C5G7W6_9RHOB|nr:siderophore ABC transporter substrate-binding protein [Pelagovum pacificum]QQA41920.1 siderophore ABC transporter substrate-binding protein [Pelagovum pacificum]TNY30641.1 siderophore ABC transporter substrate-binding protein [Pelagovum pacificum]